MTKFPAVLGLLCAASACSSSVLIHRDDATFAHAQQRAARTAALVEKENPPPAERLLFLEAEGFYRYRYEPPPRGLLSNFVQAAAVAVEFPVLQALAGSLDLQDLRLKTYDGAIHLWESFLELYPRSTLGPLVLYRLGWAYRSSGASGFPRESGNGAFDQLIVKNPTSPLVPLAREAKLVPWKSKDSAAAFSLLPGGGQIYVGEYGNGISRMAVALASVAAIIAPAYIAYHRRGDLTWHGDWPLLAIGVGGIIALSVEYTVAYQDAVRGVVQFNEREEARFEDRHPEAP